MMNYVAVALDHGREHAPRDVLGRLGRMAVRSWPSERFAYCGWVLK